MPMQTNIAGYVNNQPSHPHMSFIPRQPMFPFGPRLPLSAIHPSTSTASAPVMFNSAPNTTTPNLGHPLLLECVVESGAKNYAKSNIHMPGFTKLYFGPPGSFQWVPPLPFTWFLAGLTDTSILWGREGEISKRSYGRFRIVLTALKRSLGASGSLQKEAPLCWAHDLPEGPVETPVYPETALRTSWIPPSPPTTDSFVLEVPNELPILKEGVHAALPKYRRGQLPALAGLRASGPLQKEAPLCWAHDPPEGPAETPVYEKLPEGPRHTSLTSHGSNPRPRGIKA
ncbi:hypothetical protein Scep_002659 [Stephania cephalantha]|uniref:Uncharacterized protein n=1 Tax=Stephania cephalantha TaxID=152367 RepID=A0AAP0Q564_9MAGN